MVLLLYRGGKAISITDRICNSKSIYFNLFNCLNIFRQKTSGRMNTFTLKSDQLTLLEVGFKTGSVLLSEISSDNVDQNKVATQLLN